MRFTPLPTLLMALALAARPASAAPLGDERTTPTYQALAKAMEELQRGRSPAHLEPQARALAPLLEGLDRRFNRGLEQRLSKAVAGRDRARFLDVLVQLVIEEGQARLTDLRRDEYYGWSDAQAGLRRFALHYQLLAFALHAAQPAAEDAIRQRLEALSQLLQRADLTTPPGEIEAAALRLRDQLAEVKPMTSPLRPRFKLVINVANPTATLTRETASRLFFRKTPAWPDGTPVEPVEQADSSPIQEAYALEIHDRSPQALRSAWNQLIFSGQAVPPPERGSDEAVRTFVKEHPGAIGYLSQDAPAAGVKVVILED